MEWNIYVQKEISAVDDSVDVAAVPPDILLLAQPNNTILVKDLSQCNSISYTIPTIDQIVKLVYSIQGNYIAVLETKVTRNGSKVSYVRVYINWKSLKEFKDSFPMRARIAGRVTPLSQNQKGLEMIEIPNSHMPENVSCCPVSGNLLILSKNILNIYTFVIETHNISKTHFIDFKPLNIDIQVSFFPTKLKLLEDTVAILNNKYLHIFRIKCAALSSDISDKEFFLSDCDKNEIYSPQAPKKFETIDYEKLIKELEELKSVPEIISQEEIKKKTYNQNISPTTQSELSKINKESLPVKHIFPTVLLEKCLIGFRGDNVFRQNPFLPINDLNVKFVCNSSSSNILKTQLKAISLRQYRLIPLTIGSISNEEIQEKFTSLILKPYYSNVGKEINVKQRVLESDHFGKIKCIACFFGTQQEGFLQCFEYNENDDIIICHKYMTYAFTAPVFEVQLDDCFLHAITEVGLETYTLRAAKHLQKNDDFRACPSPSDPVCLIGLHPFVNVFRTCITQNYLILFANNEESSSTLYQLKFPDAASIWKDFKTAAYENMWEAPSTYCELIGEGHLILKTKLQILQWTSQNDSTKSQIYLATASNNLEETLELESLYKKSCAFLGDYHILHKNYHSSYCYYTMSEFKTSEIIKRIRNLHNTIPENHRKMFDSNDITKGLIYFLKKTLFYFDQKYQEFVGNREEFFNLEIGNLVSTLMDLLDSEKETSISDLVLESIVLRVFSSDRILKMLKNLLSKSSVPREKDALSLVLMCIQRDQSEQAKTVLLTMIPNQLEILLVQYYDLLFENNNCSGINMFTELSMVLLEIYPDVLATVLSELISKKRVLSLSKVLKIFMEPTGCIPSKNSYSVLQTVLENYFKFYSENFLIKQFDSKKAKALKILIRIYWTHLQLTEKLVGTEKNDRQENITEILFYKYRPQYLNQIPPLACDLSHVFCPQEYVLESQEEYQGQKLILIKLQSILSFNEIPEDCVLEIRNLLLKETNVFGGLSLRVLSAASLQEAINLLINFAPIPLCHFCKDRIKEKIDWKYLVVELHKKIIEVKEDSRLKFYFEQILSEILHYLAENLNAEDLVDIIPNDYENAQKYFALAQNNAQANHLKTLIMITGKQLLASL